MICFPLFHIHQTYNSWDRAISKFDHVNFQVKAMGEVSNVGILENKPTLYGSGVIAAPQIIGLISFWTGMYHEYFFEVVNVLSCSPFMFENTENKQVDWRIRHSHLASTLFHSLVPWWRPRRIRPQITRLSQLENSAMGTWPIYKNSIIPDWFEK